MTPEGKQFLWLNLQRTVDKRGRTGKKGAGIRPLGGDTWLKAIKMTMTSKKGRETLSCTPGDTNPSDATGYMSLTDRLTELKFCANYPRA